MLIFNEKEHCRKLLESGFEKFPNKRDLKILCKHWLEQGTPRKELVAKMVEFCKNFNPHFNYAQNEELLLTIVEDLNKKEPRFSFCNEIKVFENEIWDIQQIADKNLQKIAFVLVALAKWRSANFIYINSASSIKIKDIFTLAGLKKPKKEQLHDLFLLNESGFCDIQLKPLNKLFIPCIQNDGNIKLQFIIDNNLIQNWFDFIGPHCQVCGKGFEKHNNKQKYCKDCAKKINIQKTIQNRQSLK